MKHRYLYGLLGILLLFIGLVGTGAWAEVAPTPPASSCPPEQSATPLERPGLSNLYRVTDTLYRGAQPTKDGMKELEKLGVKTVVNLRGLHSDRDELEGVNVGYERIATEPWTLDEQDVIRFLNIATDPARTPVFVHCQHGSDRTGTMVAAYRIVVCGWSKQAAIKEMTEGGFGFHSIWGNLITFIEHLDIERVKNGLVEHK